MQTKHRTDGGGSLQEVALNAEPQRDSADAIRAWLKDAILKIGLRPTPLAKAAGLAPSTLLRALDPENPGSLEWRSIEKIVRTFNIAPPKIYTNRSPEEHQVLSDVIHINEEEIEHIIEKSENQTLWILNNRALDLVGYLPGDIVIVDDAVTPRARDIVVIVRIEQAGIGEALIRMYDPPYFLTETADANARKKPLLMDHDRFAIIGTVVQLVRYRK
jgi:phage repressor protein C with HTH and peptisase S24 domain